VCCVSQTVFTAGLFASYYGRVGVLGWLVETKGLNVWNRSFSGVCFHCKPPRFIGIQNLPSVSKRKCAAGHQPKGKVWLIEMAVKGGQMDVVKFLISRPKPVGPPPVTTKVILSFAVDHGHLEIAQFLYSLYCDGREGCVDEDDRILVRVGVFFA
jgi:hypothetical protein